MRPSSTRSYDVLIGVILALGFGAALLFWMLYVPYLVDPTPGLDGSRIVLFRRYGTLQAEGSGTAFSRRNVRALKAFTDRFEAVAGFHNEARHAVAGPEDPPELLPAAEVGPGFFAVFGLDAGPWDRLAGTPGARKLVVLTASARRRLFGDKPDVIGDTIQMDGEPVRVAGVLPEQVHWPGFLFAGAPEIFRLWKSESESQSAQPECLLAGRLTENAGTQAAREALLSVLNQEHLVVTRKVEAKTLDEWALRGARWLRVLLLCGLILLAGVWLNVMVLLVGRTLRLIDDWSIRQALGAGTHHLASSLVGRMLLLSFGASATGLVLAFFCRRFFLEGRPEVAGRLSTPDLAAVFIFALAITLTGTLLSSAGPFLAMRGRPLSTLLTASPSQSRGGRRLGRSLVFTQLLATCCLIVVAQAVVARYWEKEILDLGFEYRNLLALQAGLIP